MIHRGLAGVAETRTVTGAGGEVPGGGCVVAGVPAAELAAVKRAIDLRIRSLASGVRLLGRRTENRFVPISSTIIPLGSWGYPDTPLARPHRMRSFSPTARSSPVKGSK